MKRKRLPKEDFLKYLGREWLLDTGIFDEVFIMKNVIHIFGASGSGTTTLGKKYVKN